MKNLKNPGNIIIFRKKQSFVAFVSDVQGKTRVLVEVSESANYWFLFRSMKRMADDLAAKLEAMEKECENST